MARRKNDGRVRRRPQQGRFLRVRTAGIRFLNKCAFVVLVLLGCSAVALLSVPQVKELNRLESDLAFARVKEAQSLAVYDQKSREFEAIRENPEYLEIIARDRLNLQFKGEKILRIKRDKGL